MRSHLHGRPEQIIAVRYRLAQKLVRDNFQAAELQPLALKGFAEPVAIYQLEWR